MMRDQLFEQILGEFGEFMLELELNARREKGGSLQKPSNQGVHSIAKQAAKALGDSRILFRKFPRLLVKQLQLCVIEIEEFPIHARSQPIDDDFSGLDDVGNEFDGDVNGMAHQFAADHEPYLEFDGVDLVVSDYA